MNNQNCFDCNKIFRPDKDEENKELNRNEANRKRCYDCAMQFNLEFDFVDHFHNPFDNLPEIR